MPRQPHPGTQRMDPKKVGFRPKFEGVLCLRCNTQWSYAIEKDNCCPGCGQIRGIKWEK